jgi:hypothetical protein
VQASRNLQIDGMIIMEGKIHSERCLVPAPRQKHPNSRNYFGASPRKLISRK